jgi:hypothetical protein
MSSFSQAQSSKKFEYKLANFQADIRKGSVIELWDEKNNKPMVVTVSGIHRGYFYIRKGNSWEAIRFEWLKDYWSKLELYKSPLGQVLL